MTERPRAPAPLYWGGAVLLIAFGALTGFSIGIPFLVFGLVLVLLAPFRGRTEIFVPALVAVPAFFAGFLLVAPLGCTATATVTESPGGSGGRSSLGTTSCGNLLGIDYSGEGIYNPPLWPAALAGLAVAAVTGTASFQSIRRNPPTKPKSGRSGWIGVGINLVWTLFLAGLGLFSGGALDPQWPIALIFVCLTAVPAVIAILGLRGRAGLLLTAGIVCVPMSLMSLAGATLPLLLPGICYFIAYYRSAQKPTYA